MSLPNSTTRSEVISKNVEFQKRLAYLREKLTSYLDRNIIVLSSDQATRESVVFILKNLGFPEQNITATNFANQVANQIKETRTIRLVICDIKIMEFQRPTISADRFYERIKKEMMQARKKLEVPFVIMAPNFGKKEILSGYRVGISDFIVTPTDETILGDKILGIFQKKREGKVALEVRKLIREGDEYQQQGLIDLAIKSYDTALKVGGDNAEVLTKKGDALFSEGRYDEAMALYKRAVECEKNYPRTHQGLANCYSFQGDYTRASVHYKKVLEFEPENIAVIHHLGTINLEQGNHDGAIKYFKKGVEINPRTVNNYIGLAKTHEDRNEIGVALRYYRDAIKAQPKQQHLYVAAGNFCLKHQQPDVAEVFFNKSIELNKNDVYLYNRRGIALRKQHKNREAIANYSRALKLTPEDGNIYYNLAKAWMGEGHYENVKKGLKLAFSLDGSLRNAFEKDRDFEACRGKVTPE